ncbi:hypothetical protein [Prevotella nigrescens]|uniref:hypothetical protein n=1 Tax=Prevotella nigrescens TaxID=28133 RepID=UPI0028D8D2B0|nr:hypothetical protein [Prevotella nigrescens]
MSLTRIVFSTAVKIASGLRQSSLRGYGNHRFGVTAIVASGLRQSPLRGYGKCRYEVPINTAVLMPRNSVS